jgi:hypothetical protein
MRNLLLSVALISGLMLPVAHAQSTGTVTATCKDGTAFTGTKRSGACRGHGGVQSWGEAPAQSTHPLRRRSRRRQTRALLRHRRAPGKFGSIPPVRFIIVPVIGGTARPSTAVTCPKRKRRRRAPGRIMARLAPGRDRSTDQLCVAGRRGWASNSSLGLRPGE